MARTSRILIACAGALALAACVTVTTTPGPAPSPPAVAQPDTIPLVIAKVEYGFEATYNAAGHLYLAAAPHLAPATKVRVKNLMVQAYAAVKAARTAKRLGDATELAAQVALITELCTQVTNLIHGDGQ